MILSHKLIKIIFLGLFVLITFNGISSTVRADDSIQDTPHYREPSSPGYSLGPWVTVSGFKLQPKSEYFTKVNQSVTIKTTLNKNWLSSSFDWAKFQGASYKWYELDPGGQWHEITTRSHGVLGTGFWSTDKSHNSPEYTFKSNRTGVYYFQVFAQVLPAMAYFNPPLYSTVAKVTVQKNNVATQRITSVFTDASYMLVNKDFQNQTMFAHAKVFPDNATDTDNIIWSTNTPDLISIDPHSGEIHVNKNQKIGNASVTASIGHIDSKTTGVSVLKMLTIKNDITSFNSHDTAYFYLNGPFENNNEDKIIWHRIINNKDTIFLEENGSSLTINDLNPTYNNAQIYAEVQSVDPSKKSSQHTVKSNKITINVDSTSPSFETQHQIIDKPFVDDSSNSSNPSNSSNDEADDVIVGDKLTHIITISNTSESNKNLVTNGSLIFKFCPNELINTNDITIQGKPVDPKNIQIKNNMISINNIDTNLSEKTEISISSTVNNIDSKRFTYEPEFTSHLTDNTIFPVNIEPTYATFTTDSIDIVEAPHIKFGKLIVAQKALRNRVSPKDNDNVLIVDDNRRHKSPVSLWLHFSDGFKNEKLEPIKNLNLHYFDDDQQELGKYNKVVNIETSPLGQPLHSITWPIDEGLKLSIDNTNIPDGTYKASILWEIRDVPSNT